MLKTGDIVANKHGHVLAVGKVLEDGFIIAYYQTNAEMFHKYKEEDLRLLSSYKGVEIEGEKFQETIRKCLERSGVVERKVRGTKEVTGLEGFSKEDLQELLRKAEELYGKKEETELGTDSDKLEEIWKTGR